MQVSQLQVPPPPPVISLLSGEMLYKFQCHQLLLFQINEAKEELILLYLFLMIMISVGKQ